MSIVFVGSSGGSLTAPLPPHQAGDLILCVTNSTSGMGNTKAPTPAGWTKVTDGASAAGTYVIFSLTALDSETEAPVFSLQIVEFQVYRSSYASGVQVSTGAVSSSTGTTSSTSFAWPALTLTEGGLESWVTAFSIIRSNTVPSETPPDGFTNRSKIVQTTPNLRTIAGHDTNGAVTGSISAYTQTFASAILARVAILLEIIEIGTPPAEGLNNVFAKVGGAYKTATPFAKSATDWNPVTVTGVFTKVAGAWTQVT